MSGAQKADLTGLPIHAEQDVVVRVGEREVVLATGSPERFTKRGTSVTESPCHTCSADTGETPPANPMRNV